MKKVSIALLTAGMLALTACGGGEEANTSANGVDEYNVAGDNLGATDNLALPADLNAADGGNLADPNLTTTNATTAEETNAATTNAATTNSQ